MAQIDRRIRRTRKLLGDALISLALEKAYDEISIQEITDRADIGYRTFFRHYSDIDQLLKDVLSTLMLELRSLMTPPDPKLLIAADFKLKDWENGIILFRHVQEHGDLYRVLLHSERSLVDSIVEFTTKEIRANLGSVIIPGVPVEIIAGHMVSTTLALVRWWLDTDMTTPPEVMQAYSFKLIAEPIRSLLVGGIG